jgi:L-alanine-DL-glutamate epimerase-like enolase superfamily enzyme
MKRSLIEQVDIHVVKLDRHYRLSGTDASPNRLPGTDYYFEPQWRQVYSRLTETCLVRITTADGTTGWGEAQSPIAPEVTAALLRRLLGPAVLGHDALATEWHYDRLYHLMSARGQQYGYYLDAIGAIDMALWDIRGRTWQAPVAALLGGPVRNTLPAYVSGLRKPALEDRVAVARESMGRGFAGVKLFSGSSSGEILEEIALVREAIGDGGFLGFDAINAFDTSAALRLGAVLDRQNAGWFEAPVASDDLAGHARLAQALATPVAGGETLRSAAQFLPWLQAGALQVVQPDVVRCGVTTAKRVADLAQAFQARTALHLGVCTGIGVAATWQVAAALPGFLVQEHQLDLFETANRVLRTPLEEMGGKLIVPLAAGLGVEVDEDAVRDLTTEHWTIRSSD